MALERPVGIGIIGSGGIAQNAHMPAYDKLQNEGKVKIVAVSDANPDTAAAVAKKFNVPHQFDDYAKMLEMEEIDAVDICTPNFLHRQPAIDALNAGKHVLVEKPIALNAIEGAEMVEAAKRNKKKLQVALNMRFGQVPQAVKRFIKDGKLGEIYYARAQALRRRGVPSWGVFTQKDKQGGGPLIDIGVHILDLTLWMMDYPEPASVSGTSYTKFGTREGMQNTWGPWNTKNYTVEDFAVGLVKFKNGATLVLESSFIVNIEKSMMRSDIMGTEGGASIDLDNASNTKIFREESGTLTDTTPVFVQGSVGTHEAEIRSFVAAIIDDTPVEVPGEQGLMVSRILDAIYASSEQGKEIVFSDLFRIRRTYLIE